MQNFTAFTKNEKGKINVLRTEVNVIADKNINPDFRKSKEKYNAIWDTGATNTVISDKLAEELKLNSVGIATVSTAGGIFEVNKYIIGLQLPNRLTIESVMVTAGKLDENTDFLIGMDIITLGDFSITNVDNKTTFSFRYPSCKVIDYVDEAKNLHKKDLQSQLKKLENEIKKGGKCSCGSGRQFRYCHGKEQLKTINKELEKIGA